MANGDKGTKALAGLAAVGGIGALIYTLTRPRPVEAAPPGIVAPPTEIPPITVVLDEEIRQALAAILINQVSTAEGLDTLFDTLFDTLGTKIDAINENLRQILQALGVEAPPTPTPPAAEERLILQPFQKDSQTLQSGTPFPIYEKSPGKGALIWAVIDISSPTAKVAFRFDDLLWEFEYDTLRNQGVDSPLAPGVWLSKYDLANSHFAMIFSAGDIRGFAFTQRLLITVTYTGAGTATLNQGRGVVWL